MSSSRSAVLTENSIAELEEQFGDALSIQNEWIEVPRRAFSSSDDNEVITIPRELNSIATLRFLGLSKESANQTWSRYSTFLQTGDDDDILSFVLGTVEGGQDTGSIDDYDWVVAMRTMGAGKVLRNRIMTPGFDFVRLTKSPKAWVLETIEER